MLTNKIIVIISPWASWYSRKPHDKSTMAYMVHFGRPWINQGSGSLACPVDPLPTHTGGAKSENGSRLKGTRAGVVSGDISRAQGLDHVQLQALTSSSAASQAVAAPRLQNQKGASFSLTAKEGVWGDFLQSHSPMGYCLHSLLWPCCSPIALDPQPAGVVCGSPYTRFTDRKGHRAVAGF